MSVPKEWEIASHLPIVADVHKNFMKLNVGVLKDLKDTCMYRFRAQKDKTIKVENCKKNTF